MTSARSRSTESPRLAGRLLQILTGNWSGIRGATPPTVPLDGPPTFRDDSGPLPGTSSGER